MLATSSKGNGEYVVKNPDLMFRIYGVAVRKANQMVVQQASDRPSRHIPRDVRQRVWQAYGGKCAECSATDYLEYDHIIPVARGGTSHEKNV